MGIAKSKSSTKEELKIRIQDYNTRLQRALIGCGQAKTTFTTLSDLWSTSRQEVVTTLTSVADEIDRHHHNVNIASLTGTSSSIAGGTAAIAGLVLAPFTGGLSIALATGGLVGAVAGSATTLGANIAEVVLTKELMDRAKKVLETDSTYTTALRAAFRELVLHENDVITILAELKHDSFTEELEKFLEGVPNSEQVKSRLSHAKEGANSMEDILALVACLYPEDHEFLQQLNKTDELFSQTPSLSSALTTSSGFLQAMKELVTLGPETLRSLSGAVVQSSAATTAQAASLGVQMMTAGLGAIFVALDVHQFMRTSQNIDHGSKTELAEKIRDIVNELVKEKEQVEKLSEFYRLKS